MTKYCLYPQFPGFIPHLNPVEIKKRLKEINYMPINLVMKVVDEYGKFLEWYEEIYSGKRDESRARAFILHWRESVVALNQEYIEPTEETDLQKIKIRLLCLGWIAGEDTYLINL